MFRLAAALFLSLAGPIAAAAAPDFFPARSGRADAPVLNVYSSLDDPLAQPLIDGFQSANPDIAVRHENMLTGEIYDRIVRETDAGQKTADFAFSSAMDLQVKLANDGYAQPSDLPLTRSWDGVGEPAERFIRAEDVAEAVFSAFGLSPQAVVEEIVIRPQLGDLL